MKIYVSFIDTFQYYGPYATNFEIEDESVYARAIQDSSTKGELKAALTDLLFVSDVFLQHMKDTWAHPYLNVEKDQLACDANPTDFLHTMRNWWDRSFSRHNVLVARADARCPKDRTCYQVEESDRNNDLYDTYMCIQIDHTIHANPALKEEFKIPTEEEEKERKDKEAMECSTWDCDDWD